MTEDNAVVRARYFTSIQDETLIFNAPFKKFTEDVYADPIFNPKLEKDKKMKTDNTEYLKSEAIKELGEDATEQEIQSFVEDKIDEIRTSEEISKEIYDNQIPHEGDNIMDSGYNYGDQPQGIENAGDGFDDEEANEIWEPIHEPDVL
jgi:hypothetical protein